MSDSSRTTDDARAAFQSCRSPDPKDQVQYYNSWAGNYEKDHSLMDFRAPDLAVNFLSHHFSGNSEEVLVLDVACGSGWVAKLMVKLGFRNFVGVDGSEGMLKEAAKTGLYQDLRLAVLGPDPLPAQAGTFDVVVIVGALDAGFVPVGAVRELCSAAKPGGLVCMVRGNHTGAPAEGYKQELETEMKLMEEEGLWSPVEIRQEDKYMVNPHLDPDRGDAQQRKYISGSLYLFRRSASRTSK